MTRATKANTTYYYHILRLLFISDTQYCYYNSHGCPDSKVHGANMEPDPGGPHVGPMNFAIWLVHKLIEAEWRIYASVN